MGDATLTSASAASRARRSTASWAPASCSSSSTRISLAPTISSAAAACFIKEGSNRHNSCLAFYLQNIEGDMMKVFYEVLISMDVEPR